MHDMRMLVIYELSASFASVLFYFTREKGNPIAHITLLMTMHSRYLQPAAPSVDSLQLGASGGHSH